MDQAERATLPKLWDYRCRLRISILKPARIKKGSHREWDTMAPHHRVADPAKIRTDRPRMFQIWLRTQAKSWTLCRKETSSRCQMISSKCLPIYKARNKPSWAERSKRLPRVPINQTSSVKGAWMIGLTPKIADSSKSSSRCPSTWSNRFRTSPKTACQEYRVRAFTLT